MVVFATWLNMFLHPMHGRTSLVPYHWKRILSYLVYFAKIFEKSRPKGWNNSAAGVFATYCCACHSSAHGPSSASRISRTLKHQMINCAKSNHKYKLKCLDQQRFEHLSRVSGLPTNIVLFSLRVSLQDPFRNISWWWNSSASLSPSLKLISTSSVCHMIELEGSMRIYTSHTATVGIPRTKIDLIILMIIHMERIKCSC